MTALLIAIYVAGYVAAYLLLKKLFIVDTGEWTIGFRWFVLFFSLLSWTSSLAAMLLLLKHLVNDDRPAKW